MKTLVASMLASAFLLSCAAEHSDEYYKKVQEMVNDQYLRHPELSSFEPFEDITVTTNDFNQPLLIFWVDEYERQGDVNRQLYSVGFEMDSGDIAFIYRPSDDFLYMSEKQRAEFNPLYEEELSNGSVFKLLARYIESKK